MNPNYFIDAMRSSNEGFKDLTKDWKHKRHAEIWQHSNEPEDISSPDNALEAQQQIDKEKILRSLGRETSDLEDENLNMHNKSVEYNTWRQGQTHRPEYNQ